MSWTAVVAALDDGDTFRSSVSMYLHPLAGRPILWHALLTLAASDPRPDKVRVLHRSVVAAAPAGGVPGAAQRRSRWRPARSSPPCAPR